MLTALQIRNARAGNHADGGGLYLQVSKAGSKSWIFRYQLERKRREMGLGSLDAVSAIDARAQAGQLLREVKSKVDPLLRRRAELAARQQASVFEAAAATTFASVAHDYVDAHSPSWRNAKHSQQWSNTLESYVYPVFGNKAVAEVATADVLAVLQPIWITKNETASRLRSRIELILSFAKAKQLRSGENPAMWRGHLDAILPRPGRIKQKAHRPALPFVELPQFMRELRGMSGSGARALEFLIMTAARSSEVRLATWSEFDLTEGIWAIPAHRMKARKEHRVPLAFPAVALLNDLPRMEGLDLVFFGQLHQRPLSDMTLSAVVRRLNGKEARFIDRRTGRPVVPHGFRSTFRDWVAETTTYPSDLAEMALAHTISNKVEAAYRRGDMFDRRRAMMAEWAAFTSF